MWDDDHNPILGTISGGGGGGGGGNAGGGGGGGGGTSATGTYPPCGAACGTAQGPLIGPQPILMPFIPPLVASPEYTRESTCGMYPIELMCNPEDGVLGGGDDGFRELGAKWAAGLLDRSGVYGQDSEIALQVMMTDLTAAQRKEILKNYRSGKISGRLSNSISDDGDGGASQFKSDVKSLVTGDHNLATAALGSYTAKYEVLRANGRGLQYRMTIKNSMTASSLAHIATGYGTPSERFIQRWIDNDGIIAARGAGRVHDMEITFRGVIYFGSPLAR